MALKRRTFLQKTALAAAGLTIIPRQVLGGNGFIAPSDKINLGVVGLGRMGFGLGKRFGKLDMAQIVAACDVDDTKTTRFKKEIEKVYTERESTAEIQIYKDFREMITRDDIDGVIVATPDHWHAIISIMAMKEGKDIYCEKPMAHTVKEGRTMVKAARKYERVFQTGSMQRSRKTFRHACELVRNGYIGDIEKVVVSIGKPAVSVPCSLPHMATPEHLDWNTWLGPAQVRSYHSDLAPLLPETFWGKWRAYEEFGGGMLADWGAHMFDIAQWGLGMDHTGPVEYIPPITPLSQEGMVFKYANGVVMVQESFGRGNAVKFIGSEGTINISRQFLDSDPASLVDKEIGEDETRLYHSDNHYQDWLDCIKSREKPICDVEIGHRTSTICNIANITYKLGRTLKWNPEKEKFIKDGEANLKLTKKYRKEWKLPKA